MVSTNEKLSGLLWQWPGQDIRHEIHPQVTHVHGDDKTEKRRKKKEGTQEPGLL